MIAKGTNPTRVDARGGGEGGPMRATGTFHPANPCPQEGAVLCHAYPGGQELDSWRHTCSVDYAHLGRHISVDSVVSSMVVGTFNAFLGLVVSTVL